MAEDEDASGYAHVAIVYDWNEWWSCLIGAKNYMKNFLVNACARRASTTYRLTKALEDRLSTEKIVALYRDEIRESPKLQGLTLIWSLFLYHLYSRTKLIAIRKTAPRYMQ